jgi:hypothetical protein
VERTVHLPDTFHVQIGLNEGDALSSLLFNSELLPCEWRQGAGGEALCELSALHVNAEMAIRT